MTRFRLNLRILIATAICLAAGITTTFAQEHAILIMKDGIVVGTFEISGNEKIVFQDPKGGTTPASDNALIVKQANGTTVSTLLDKIEEITMADGLLSVNPFSGTPAIYAISNVAKLSFEGGASGINDITVDSAQIVAYYNIMGIRLPQAPEKGFYIILYDNGTTKKVIKF